MAPLARWVLALAALGEAALHAEALVTVSKAGRNASGHSLGHGCINASKIDPGERAADSSVQCLTNTGGTCMVQQCNANRGATVCSWGVCWCQGKSCSGADGRCYEKPNKVLLQSFRLRNVRWPDLYLSASAWSSAPEAKHDPLTPQSQFTLRELPDGAMMLTSDAYPDYVLTTLREQECTDRSNSTGPRDCVTTYKPKLTRLNNRPAPALAVRITAAPERKGAIMLSSFDFPQRYYYVPHFFSSLSSQWEDPGDMGYWLPDKPLNFQPEAFKGRRCSFDCSGSVRDAHAGGVVALVLSVAACLAATL